MLDPEGLCPKGVPRGLPPRGLWFRGLGTGFGLVFREDPPYLMLLTWSKHIQYMQMPITIHLMIFRGSPSFGLLN